MFQNKEQDKIPGELSKVMIMIRNLPNKEHKVIITVGCSVAKLCPTLCNPMGHSMPGSSAHGDFQARILEWIAFPSPRDLPTSDIEPMSPALTGRFFTN